MVMQDIEFTVQENRLWMLQCRSGKRTGAGAVKIAVDMVGEGLVEPKDAIKMVEPQHLDQLLHPQVHSSFSCPMCHFQLDFVVLGMRKLCLVIISCECCICSSKTLLLTGPVSLLLACLLLLGLQ